MAQNKDELIDRYLDEITHRDRYKDLTAKPVALVGALLKVGDPEEHRKWVRAQAKKAVELDHEGVDAWGEQAQAALRQNVRVIQR